MINIQSDQQIKFGGVKFTAKIRTVKGADTYYLLSFHPPFWMLPPSAHGTLEQARERIAKLSD